MSAENHAPDTLPIFAERGFDTAMRGYDRRQVDLYVGQLEDELHATVVAREDAVAQLTAQLASTNAQLDSLRRQLQAAAEPANEENVEPRVRKILESARTEAARFGPRRTRMRSPLGAVRMRRPSGSGPAPGRRRPRCSPRRTRSMLPPTTPSGNASRKRIGTGLR